MNDPHRDLAGRRALAAAATAWFVVASLGQWAFVAFILAFHLPPTLGGDFTALNAKPHITGWVPGDTLGNVQLLLHVFLGALVTGAGVLQLVPALRRRWPAMHRWNGRIFMLTALVATLTGFYLTWVRGSQLNLASAISTSLNGLLILVFVALAWRSALLRDFASHRRHAIRAWLLVNGVWFLRIGIMLAGIALAPLGIDMNYDAPVFLAVSFLSWLAPIAVAEACFVAERSPRAGARYLMAAVLTVVALATAAGGVAAVVFMWWPRM